MSNGSKPISVGDVAVVGIVVVAALLFVGFMAEDDGRQRTAEVACRQQGFTNGEYTNGEVICWDVEKKLLGTEEVE